MASQFVDCKRAPDPVHSDFLQRAVQADNIEAHRVTAPVWSLLQEVPGGRHDASEFVPRQALARVHDGRMPAVPYFDDDQRAVVGHDQVEFSETAAIIGFDATEAAMFESGPGYSLGDVAGFEVAGHLLTAPVCVVASGLADSGAGSMSSG